MLQATRSAGPAIHGVRLERWVEGATTAVMAEAVKVLEEWDEVAIGEAAVFILDAEGGNDRQRAATFPFQGSSAVGCGPACTP